MNQLARMRDGLALLVILATPIGCTSAEVKAVRGMPIKKIDLLQVQDGGYLGKSNDNARQDGGRGGEEYLGSTKE